MLLFLLFSILLVFEQFAQKPQVQKRGHHHSGYNSEAYHEFIYLPLVRELKEFWTGVAISCDNYNLNTLCIRPAVICCACDISATRKLCGFLAHSAMFGCFKCLKEFKTVQISGVNRTDYSGFDRETWQPQSRDVHQLCQRC